ncbi:MAG TPA: arylsulfatase [Pantanalinema sp.]
MPRDFKGRIALDVRDSAADWSAFAPPRAPDEAPNVLYIVLDDTGFGALEMYGGLIEMPNLKRIAENGLTYTQFHTTALCSPTRSCLLTGRNATSNGMACITEGASGFPGSNGHIPFENAFISEVLLERGYNTYALGKWHLTPDEECNMAGTKVRWPLGRGFERFYGFLGGETDQWYPDLVYDNHPVEPPYSPQEGYHFSRDVVDKAIRFVRDAKVIAPEKPWMMYFCPGCAHAPHQVWKDWADRYAGKFDMGYEEYRKIVLANQKKRGIVPESTELPAINPFADVKGPEGQPWPEGDTVRPWESLSAEEKKLFCRMAEVYAGYLSYTDHEIGRLLDYLQESNQLDNTIVVVVSDNGASGEGGPNGSVNENKFFNGIPDRIEANMKDLDVLGSEATYNHYPTGWAMAFNTPFKMFKRYASYEGGSADACIVSWPKGIKARGELRDQYIHAIDLVPTLYECLGITPPDAVKGYTQAPIEGTSFKETFDDAKAPGAKLVQFYTMLGTRGVWYQGWHASTVHPPTPSGWGHFEADRWELFNLAQDRNQMRDLAAQMPEKLEQLKNLWFMQAGKYKGLPLDDRSAVEILGTARREIAKPRSTFVYYPDTEGVPESVAADIRGRSYNIVAEVRLTSPEAEGVLFADGSRFGGHTLFVKDGKLCYTFNWLGERVQKLVSDSDVPLKATRLGVRFRMEQQDPLGFNGSAALYIDDRKVAEAPLLTQTARFGLSGGALLVGRSGAEAVSDDYVAPFRFKGGVIKQLVFDLSGETYRDFNKELAMMMSRD